jgi:hypothetical protein
MRKANQMKIDGISETQTGEASRAAGSPGYWSTHEEKEGVLGMAGKARGSLCGVLLILPGPSITQTHTALDPNSCWEKMSFPELLCSPLPMSPQCIFGQKQLWELSRSREKSRNGQQKIDHRITAVLLSLPHPWVQGVRPATCPPSMEQPLSPRVRPLYDLSSGFL